ncbi:hypothetical protein AB0G82_35735 [Streptomyces anulatus]
MTDLPPTLADHRHARAPGGADQTIVTADDLVAAAGTALAA